VLKANFVVFQVVEEFANDAHNLFLVEEVQNLRNMLNNVELEVTE